MSLQARCILAVGFGFDDEWRLEKAWMESGLEMALRFAPEETEAMRRLQQRETPPTPAVLLVNSGRKELLRWVRRQQSLRELIAIVCDGECNEEEIKRAYALGADACARKGSDFAEAIRLLKRVEDYWRKARYALDAQQD